MRWNRRMCAFWSALTVSDGTKVRRHSWIWPNLDFKSAKIWLWITSAAVFCRVRRLIRWDASNLLQWFKHAGSAWNYTNHCVRVNILHIPPNININSSATGKYLREMMVWKTLRNTHSGHLPTHTPLTNIRNCNCYVDLDPLVDVNTNKNQSTELRLQ